MRIACVESVIVTFLPSTMKVFFCRLGLKTRFVRRKEKLTLWPNCLPLPVSSQRAAISLLLKVILQTCTIVPDFTERVNRGGKGLFAEVSEA